MDDNEFGDASFLDDFDVDEAIALAKTKASTKNPYRNSSSPSTYYSQEKSGKIESRNDTKRFSTGTYSKDNKRPKVGATALYATATKNVWEKALERYFGHSKFRSGQWEVMEAISEGRDVGVFWATGSGKSMCYQLPPLVLQSINQMKTSLVISPLISLMQDQVAKINGQLGEAVAVQLSTDNNNTINISTQQAFQQYRIVYCTPEKLSSTILPFLQTSPTCSNNLCLVAIDESHCVSEWGHDFRPEYQRMGKLLKQHLPQVPKLALTATAVPHVQQNILENLYFNPQHSFISQKSFDRDNLIISIKRKEAGGFRSTLQFLIEENNSHGFSPYKSTIIYCPTRDLVEQITVWLKYKLQNKSINVQAYHAGLPHSTRTDAHFQFLVGKTQIIVATIAFGMGIDKPDVRQIIHFGPPKTVEAYYQQIGRAGRDGYPAHCIMFCDTGDFAAYKSDFYLGNLNGKVKETMSNSIDALQSFAMNEKNCRRVALLNFFGETPMYDRCGTCDTCIIRKEHEGDLERDFASSGARLILYVFSVLSSKVGFTVFTNVLNGKIVESYRYRNRNDNPEIIKKKVLKMKSDISGRKKNKNYFKDLLNSLVERDYVRCGSHSVLISGSNFKQTYAAYDLTQKGWLALNDLNTPIVLTTPASVREMERIEKEKLEKTLCDLEKKGVNIKQIPEKELENGDGEILKALRTWYNYLDTLRKNERFDRVDQLDDLYSRIDAWRMDMALKYKMSPSAVMPDHLLVKVAYATASLRGGQKMEKAALIAAGVRSGGIESLIETITDWIENNQDETKSTCDEDFDPTPMVFSDYAFKPSKPWDYAVYKPAKKTGLASWESSYNRFQAGEHPQTIAMSPVNGRPIQVATVISHILDGLTLGRSLSLKRLAESMPSAPPTKGEWAILAQAEIDTCINVTGDPNTCGVNGERFKMSDFLCPIMGNEFAAKEYNERTEDEKAKFSKWCGLLKWYMSFRRVGFEPIFGDNKEITNV